MCPARFGATGVSAGVAAANDLLDDMFILPVMCVLTAFALPVVLTRPAPRTSRYPAFRLGGSWTESGVTWSNQPAMSSAPGTSH